MKCHPVQRISKKLYYLQLVTNKAFSILYSWLWLWVIRVINFRTISPKFSFFNFSSPTMILDFPFDYFFVLHQISHANTRLWKLHFLDVNFCWKRKKTLPNSLYMSWFNSDICPDSGVFGLIIVSWVVIERQLTNEFINL